MGPMCIMGMNDCVYMWKCVAFVETVFIINGSKNGQMLQFFNKTQIIAIDLFLFKTALRLSMAIKNSYYSYKTRYRYIWLW